MDKELLKELGIDENSGLKAVLESLESRQFECLERLETVSDENRKKELELLLSKIDKEIAETKEEIKTLKSGIILDQGETHEGGVQTKVVPEKKKESSSKQNSEEVQKKVEALKTKEAEKQAKEAERQQKAAEKAAKDVQASVGLTQNQSNVSGSSNNNGSNANPELTNALLNYKKGDYSKAFEGLKKLAEANDETAQYVLANMYNRGEGTSQDAERAEYWMKRSADGGYATAQLDYGILKLANNNNDDSIIAEGLKYVQMAADQGDKQAMLKYIEVAKKQIGGRQVCDKAIYYCTKLINEVADSYDKDQYHSDKSELEAYRKEDIDLKRKKKRSTIFTIIGSVLIVLGGLYLLNGIHPDLWQTFEFLAVLPDASSLFTLPLSAVEDTLAEIMNRNGMFGLELIFIGEMFVSAGNYIGKREFAKLVQMLSLCACIVIALWHFGALIMEGRSVLTALKEYAIVIAISYFAGKVIGILFGKIFKSR